MHACMSGEDMQSVQSSLAFMNVCHPVIEIWIVKGIADAAPHVSVAAVCMRLIRCAGWSVTGTLSGIQCNLCSIKIQ